MPNRNSAVRRAHLWLALLVLAAGALVSSIPAQAQGGDGSFHVVNGLTSTSIDVYIDNSLVVRGLQFGSASAEVTITSGSRQFVIYAAADPAPALADDRADAPLASTTRQVVDGDRATLVVHSQSSATFAESSFCRVGSVGAFVSVRNFSEAGAPLTVASDNGTVFGTISTGQRAMVQALPGQGLTVTLQITAASGAFPDTTVPAINIPAGAEVVYYVVGSGGTFRVLTTNSCASLTPDADGERDQSEADRLSRFDDETLRPGFTG